MNARTLITNATRQLGSMFPGFFSEAKHDFAKDFGFPAAVSFDMAYEKYCRDSLATAGVDKTVRKTWETRPELWETEKPKESPLEADIRKRLTALRFWQRLADADRMSMVGRYSGVILRLADSKAPREPVDQVPGGLQGLVEIVPAWEAQLIVSEWVTDEASPDYGRPKMFSYREAAVGDGRQGRVFDVHPDRVVIWSRDGTVHGRSALEPGYNDLLTLEKIRGAGGEGFYKNAASRPVLEAADNLNVEEMARAMGVDPSEMHEAMGEQVEAFNRGFDKFLLIQKMKATTLDVSLPIPEHFFAIALQSFAASLQIPVKILVGNQTGERASSEDAEDWAQANMGRRDEMVIPNIMDVVARMERFGILPERDWHLHWADLTEASMGEKIERAHKMADINSKTAATGELVYLPEEIRQVTGHEPVAGLDQGDDE